MSSKAGQVGPALFRAACARFATGITVVTTTDRERHPHGLTINSFASVSLDPPLVMVSIDRRNAMLGHFLETAHFGINVLEESQERLSRRFSAATENRFEGVDWKHGQTGVPLLDDVLAWFECQVTRSFEEGDHAVLVGRAIAAGHSEGRPLVYYASDYQRIKNTA